MIRLMKYFIYLFFIAVFVTCQEAPQEEVTVDANQSQFSTNKSHTQVLAVNGKGLKKIDNWQEYRSLNDFLKQYQTISPNEALNNSKELNDLVKVLKDSAQPEFLTSPSFKARVNLLHNETLRLYDMSSISSIKQNEVNEQVEKLLGAFSSVNSKINTVVQQQELNEQIDEEKFGRLYLDSTNVKRFTQKIDTEEKIQTPRKKVNKNLKVDKKLDVTSKKRKVQPPKKRNILPKEKQKYIQLEKNGKTKKKKKN